jgi:cyclic pyranopterin phosphate synthase
MLDRYHRNIDYLRVALTDRCNLKCWYCCGREDHRCLDDEEILTHAEFVRVLGLAVSGLGITKIRLTGGEPLLYERLEELIIHLRKIPQLKELTLTTNGLLLKEKAPMLHRAGLHRLNVSLEGATDDAYRMITGRNCLDKVLAGLDALLKAGFDKPKLNMVLCRDFEQDELRKLLEIGRDYASELRFIELMGQAEDHYPTVKDMIAQFSEQTKLIPIPQSGTAIFRYEVNANGLVLGFIPSRTHPFCGDCRRIRLASDGQLRTCLFTRQGVQLREALRQRCSDKELTEVMRQAILSKPHQAAGTEVTMIRVGG